MNNFIFLVFGIVFFSQSAFSQLCDNRCLDFDGIDDEITLFPSPISGNADFTVEMWFYSTASLSNPSSCGNNFRKLLSLNSAASSFDVGVCGGTLSFAWQDNISTDTVLTVSVGSQWHHLAVVKEGDSVSIILDCMPITKDSIGVLSTDTFRIGQGISNSAIIDNWMGQVDEIRLWDHPRDSFQIAEFKHCVLTGNELGLLAYWQLDQGIENGNNASITHATDISSNGNDGQLVDFTLLSTNSNFICSGAGLVYPNYNKLILEIKDPLQTGILNEICNDDPVHFCLLDGTTIPQPTGSNTVTWQHHDGDGWIDETDPAFGDFCFVVPPLSVHYGCDTSTNGFVDRAYRAMVEVRDLVLDDTCIYTTEAEIIRICCPITIADIQLSIDTLCEGDMPTVQITLNSNVFVMNASPYVTIEWKINGISMPAYSGQSSFSHTFIAGTTDYCFEATITNCGGKKKVALKCIHVDPTPVCGTIMGMPSPPTLTPSASNSNLYFICPGDDAAVGITTPFTNCLPQWEYSFDQINWSPLGFSNMVQNTNVLPSYLWPTGATSIFYRIACQPFSTPSACDPCFSDTLEIQLIDTPLVVTIVGNNPICMGNSSTLSISNPESSINYTWFCNGLVVGTGTTFQATLNACYWVEGSNGCLVAISNSFCLDVCEMIPIISCPLMPNECAYLGQSIILSGCDSESSCGNTNMTFQWAYNNGTLISINGCTIEHLPDPLGTIYTLTVTDANGCSAMTTRFVKPCSN